MVWRYTWKEIFPFSMTMFQLGLSFWWGATWHQHTLADNLLFLPVSIFLFWYNGLVAAHNFVHTPYFKSDLFNRLFMAFSSINLGFPFSYYHHEHLVHHRYCNDRPDSHGNTKDPTSTFACGEGGRHEPMFSYCALGLLRADLPHSFAEISRKGGGAQLTLEIITMIGALIIYLGLSWQYFVCIYLPTFYVGWFLEHLENYYEHFGGNPDDRFANSTSYYGRLYNFLFCNEGYHQEHHIRPNVHWSMRPQTRMDYRDVLDRPHRVVLNFPPVLSWLEHDRIASYDQSNCSEKISTNLSANGTVVSG